MNAVQPPTLTLKTIVPPVLFLATIGMMATDIYLPAFPAIRESFATTNLLVQLSFSLYLFPFSVSHLVYGPYAEIRGRKRAVLFGLLISLAGTLLATTAGTIYLLIVGRMLQGLGLGACSALFRTILRDAFQGNVLAHAYSFIPATCACSMALAPIIGGYIQHFFGWRSIFGTLFLWTVFGILFIWFRLPETLREKSVTTLTVRSASRHFFTILTRPIFLSYSICSLAFFCGLSSYLSVSPFLFQDLLGLSPVQYGWISVITTGCLGVGAWSSRLIIQKTDRHRNLRYGVWCILLSSFLMIALSFLPLTTFSLLIPMGLYFCGVGMSAGSVAAGALHHFPKRAGFAGSLYGALQILGGALGTAVMALLPEHSQMPLACVLFIVSLIAIASQSIAYFLDKE